MAKRRMANTIVDDDLHVRQTIAYGRDMDDCVRLDISRGEVSNLICRNRPIPDELPGLLEGMPAKERFIYLYKWVQLRYNRDEPKSVPVDLSAVTVKDFLEMRRRARRMTR